jgi:hypothetical protein
MGLALELAASETPKRQVVPMPLNYWNGYLPVPVRRGMKSSFNR